MNPYLNAATDFSQAYRKQIDASERQRRSDMYSDEAFADSQEEEANSLIGEPTPQAPIPPREYSDGVPNGTPVDMGDDRGNVLARAKRRVAEYIRTRE